MRKSKKQEQVLETRIDGVQHYHECEDEDVDYATYGFEGNYYFTSDRKLKLDQDFYFVEDPSKMLKGYGLEIELECNTINKSKVLKQVLVNLIWNHFDPSMFKYQRDGSLEGLSSAECITQVMTKEFIRNHYRDWKYAFDSMKEYGIEATTNCGMHCNMSLGLFGRTRDVQLENIKKLCFFINYHYNLSCSLLRRDRDHTRYCSYMCEFADLEETMRTNLDNWYSDHSVCCNLGHLSDGQGRFELRLVGGQKSYGAFRNTMEVIFHLVDAVKRLSYKQIMDLTEVFKGCNKYVLDRLSLCCDEQQLSIHDFESIKRNHDREFDLGNF